MAFSKICGRFAPSPTGPLHFGSLVSAVGSYLDSKHQHGRWLIRIEDLDAPRCHTHWANEIISTLADFGLQSDEVILYQQTRNAAYANALNRLQTLGLVYACNCSRKEIADSGITGNDSLIYSGNCRYKTTSYEHISHHAWRVMSDKVIQFTDQIQGEITQNLKKDVGDFVLRRADGLFAYQLAVVIDDAFQQVSHVVRGADLLDSTPRQIYLQQLLGLPTPHYLHLPIAVNAAGEKLSKQTLAAPIDRHHPAKMLVQVLDFLKQSPPVSLKNSSVECVLAWAIAHWNIEPLRGIKKIAVEDR
jgi:glutamyl-Q tRNA(Asp) synthetase